jgi:hypothetical protein
LLVPNSRSMAIKRTAPDPNGSGANFLKCMFLSGEGLCGF